MKELKIQNVKKYGTSLGRYLRSLMRPPGWARFKLIWIHSSRGLFGYAFNSEFFLYAAQVVRIGVTPAIKY